MKPAQSGVDFSNYISITDSFNILESEFVYNGAGVAVGDLNGDGWEDLFFAGNQVANELYLNRGKLQFEKVTEAAKLQKPFVQCWSSGVNILDINLDGKLDIYVCNTLNPNPKYRANLLYINQGNNEAGIPQFQEMSAAYGVADTSHSSHAQFFDYDNDGDLDLFVGVNFIEEKYPNQFIPKVLDGSATNRDNLFKNEWSDSLGHPVFRDVSLEAGLVQDGYSHSTLIYDFNIDGWQDIYVANDYQSDDLIFINNQDGTFTNQAKNLFKHYSMSAMGSDVGDINNDGQADFFTTEMQPYYNKRKKLFQGASSYQNQIFTEQYGYNYQYTRNTLQLNSGTNPETGLPAFSEIGMYAQVQETDWSWAVLFADYDNDGWKDIYIANGFPKDVTDRDFADFRAQASNLVTKKELIAAIPEVKSPNFLFRNKGDLTFENVTKDWGLSYPSFSNGAAYADLDQDGDLDLITNNIDDPAFIFENTTYRPNTREHHFLRLQLKGSPQNPDAFGASATIYAKGRQQKSFLISGRGYLSKPENALHFGIGSEEQVDSAVVQWPDGKVSKLEWLVADQVVEVNYQQAVHKNALTTTTQGNTLFAPAALPTGLLFKDEDKDFIDFNIQRTIPHKFSQYGPAIAAGDVNGDGFEDLIIGGSRGADETLFLQTTAGQFQKNSLFLKLDADKREEDAGILLFDADQDGDLDLYLVRGSGQYNAGDPLYQDVLAINDGSSKFTLAPEALPAITANGSCVKAADFDGDGDLDLFVGSRVTPGGYPLADRSYILRNESRNGAAKFVDITESVNPVLLNAGMVSDALWTDFNGDNLPDLVLASEWSPLRFFQNKAGKTLEEITSSSGIADKSGWWNSLAAADWDMDGDIDYVAGNFGENLYYRCSSNEPIHVYGSDLDNNGMIDPLISCYWQDSLGNKHEYLYHPWQDVVKQFAAFRKRFNRFGDYGEATVQDIFTEKDLENATVLSANFMQTTLIENLGNGKFAMRALPQSVQWAPVYGLLPQDVNFDGQPDLLLIGNDHGMEVQQGRADALNGLVLINQGNWHFEALSSAQSRFFVPGDARGLIATSRAGQAPLIIATQNRDSLKVFGFQQFSNGKLLQVPASACKSLIQFEDGRSNLQEWYWGSSFMSQRSRMILIPPGVRQVQFLDNKGNTVEENL